MNAAITDGHRDLHHMAHVTYIADTSHQFSTSTDVNLGSIIVTRNQAVGTRLSILLAHGVNIRLVVGVIRLLELTDFLIHGHQTWVVFADESASWSLSVR